MPFTAPPPIPARRSRRTVVACALVLTLGTAFKPVVIDDPAILIYAEQIRRTPARPYGPPPDGFPVIWYQHGQGAFDLLTPPVVPYWWAVGLAVVGDEPVLWKLWFFPFHLLFAASAYALFRRFSPGLEGRLTLFAVASPAVLPGVNLMLDVPALGLSLASVAAFLRATDGDRTSWRRVLLAGVLAGVSAQTKYIGLLLAAVLPWVGLMRGRFAAGVAAALVGAALFVGWEGYLVSVYGRSHFLVHTQQRRFAPAVADDAGFVRRVWAEIILTLQKQNSGRLCSASSAASPRP